MKKILMLFFITLSISPIAIAGQIFGNITLRGHPPTSKPERAPTPPPPVQSTVIIKCAHQVYNTITSIPGAYNIKVSETGRCVLTVNYDQQSPSIDINSISGQSARYDLEIRKDGTVYTLIRK